MVVLGNIYLFVCLVLDTRSHYVALVDLDVRVLMLVKGQEQGTGEALYRMPGAQEPSSVCRTLLLEVPPSSMELGEEEGTAPRESLTLQSKSQKG